MNNQSTNYCKCHLSTKKVMNSKFTAIVSPRPLYKLAVLSRSTVYTCVGALGQAADYETMVKLTHDCTI